MEFSVWAARKTEKPRTICGSPSTGTTRTTETDNWTETVTLHEVEPLMRNQLPSSPKNATACLSLLIAIALAFDCSAQMLSRRPSSTDVDRWESPPESVSAKERALIQEVLEPELILRVVPSRSKIVRTKVPIGRVVIGNPEIIDINEFDSMEVEVIGKQIGETTMSIWFPQENGNPQVLRYLVQVVGNVAEERRAKVSMSDLQDRVNELFPNSQVTLIPIRNRIVIRGQARDSKEASEILTLVAQQSGSNRNGGGQGRFNNRGGFGNSQNFRNGQANSQGQGNGSSFSGGSQIINLLHVPGVQQVMLKVRVAELSRQSARELGADLGGVLGSLSIGSLVDGLDDFTAILESDDVRLFLRAFASHGYGKILAEPTLVTISGKTARFIAGGEFAVPTTVGVEGAAAATTQFRGFGTEVEFTPTVVDKDLIRLQVSPSFSSLNGAASVNGIPGLNRRAVETTVDLREGQWLAIAGLIQDEQGGNRSRLPYLGSLPTIGGFFGNQATTRNETELIVLVSPELIHPLEADQVPLQLPGMEVTDPTDDDFFCRNLIEGYAGFDHRSTVWPEMDAQVRGAMGNAGGHGALRGRLLSQSRCVCGPCGFSE